jgi:hypothetical protein
MRVLCPVLVILTALPACLNVPVCVFARVCACGRSHVRVCESVRSRVRVCVCESVRSRVRVCVCESVRSCVCACVTCSHSRVSTRATFTATASDSACFACSAAERASADPDAPQLRTEWREDGGGEYPHVLEAGQQP